MKLKNNLYTFINLLCILYNIFSFIWLSIYQDYIVVNLVLFFFIPIILIIITSTIIIYDLIKRKSLDNITVYRFLIIIFLMFIIFQKILNGNNIIV
jgi:hypothetical protein